MPQPTEQQFHAAVARVVASAPPGLDEAAFNALVDQSLMSAPEASARDKMVGGFDAKMRAKGLEPTDSMRQGNANMIDGVMGGGVMTGAPALAGQLAQKFAPSASKALKSGAERLYSGILKAKDATLERFPTVVQDLLNARVPITQGGRRTVVTGLRKIGGEKQALLDAADQRAMVPRETLRGGLDDVLDDAIQTSDTPVKDMGKLARIERELIPDELGVLPSRADKIKSKLHAESDRAYRQMKMGNRVTDTTAKAKTGVANRAKQAVEAIEPRMEGVNARYASGKGQALALRDAVKRTDKHQVIGMSDLIGGALGSAGGPAGIPAGVAAMRALTHPNIGSRIAIGMNEVGKRSGGLDDAMQRALMVALSQAGQ